MKEQQQEMEKREKSGTGKTTYVFVLFTDGFHNASRTPVGAFGEAVSAHRKRTHDNCLFVGANIDAIGTGVNFGFGCQHSLQAPSTGASVGMSTLARVISGASHDAPIRAFTDAERSISSQSVVLTSAHGSPVQTSITDYMVPLPHGSPVQTSITDYMVPPPAPLQLLGSSL